jgi:hypothetical protein
LVLFCFGSGWVAADDVPTQRYVELPAADPAFKWTFWYRDYGVPCPICESVADLAPAQKRARPSFCALVQDAIDSSEFREPSWTAVPVGGQLGLVRRTIALANAGRDPRLEKDLDLARGLSDDALTAVFWARYGRFIDPLVGSGAVTLETTQIDIDNDGTDDTLYRLRQVRRAETAVRKFDDWTTVTCRADHPEPQFYLLAFDKDSPALAAFFRIRSYIPGAQIIRYRGHTYLWRVGPDGGAIEQMNPTLSLRQVFYGQYSLAPAE